MARRTIRAQRASPYLLYLVIGLALLTVAGGVLAGWMYSLKNKVNDEVFGKARIESSFGKTEELWRETRDGIGKVNPDLTNAPLVEVLEVRQKLADEYRSEIQRLAASLSGDPLTTFHGTALRQNVSSVLKSTSDALAKTFETVKASYEGSAPADIKVASIQSALTTLAQRIDGLAAQIKTDAGTIEKLKTQIAGLQEENAAVKAEAAKELAKVVADAAAEKTALEKAREDALALSKASEAEKTQVLDRMIAIGRTHTVDKEKLTRQTQVLQANLKDLTAELGEVRKVPTETNIDGRIIRLAEGGQVAYGDLGKKDGVLLGMTFSIFAPTELGKPQPLPKAQCRIVKIMDNSCELRIYLLQGDNPVVTGDVLHNPVYDRQRRLRFVLVGKMDIDGDGVDDSEQLKGLIQEFGGRVDPTLTVQTDYLIVGEEPGVVAPLAAGASPMERQVYEEARKRFIDYSEAKAKAENFSIPVLSLNRFMGLVGLAGQN